MTKNKLLFLLCLLLGNYAWGQTALTSTTLASAVDSTQAFIIPASTTGFAAFKIAVVDQEAMLIVAVLPSGTVQVQRGYASSRANAHNATATVYVGPTNAFLNADPSGACSALNTFSPTINLTTGSQWSCSGGLWSQAAATPAAFNSLNGAVFATGTVQQAMTSAGVNGLSFVYPNYSGTDAPSATRFNSLLGPAISSQANGSHLIDYRYGGTAESTFNWPSDGLISTWFSPYQRLCNWSQAIGATAGVNL